MTKVFFCSYHRKFSLLKFSVIFAKPKMPCMSIRQLCEVMDVKSLQEYPVMLEFLKAPLLVHQLSVWSGMRFVAAARELAAELESDLLWDTGTGSNLLILILEKLKKCNLIYETLQAVAESCLFFFFFFFFFKCLKNLTCFIYWSNNTVFIHLKITRYVLRIF